MIDLRHEASHKNLPSVGRLRAGATFCLRWLKQYYWKQYQEIQGTQIVAESCPASPELGVARPHAPLLAEPKEVQPAGDVVTTTALEEGGTVWKLTRGLCNTRFELVDLLTSSTFM